MPVIRPETPADMPDLIELTTEALLGETRGVCRLFHGRGQCFPGFEQITVDLYAPYILITRFRGTDYDVSDLARALMDVRPDLAGVVVQTRDKRRTQVDVLHGARPGELTVTEAGSKFLVRLDKNQNVGLFLDMADTRAWLKGRSDGANVLNLFAYTCAFSVAALTGGAKRVVNVDMSGASLNWGEANHRLNDHELRSVWMIRANVMKAWAKMRKTAPYEIVIIDPPTNQAGSFNVEKQYPQILRRLPELLAPGGQVLACLNSPYLNLDYLPSQAARWCPGLRFEGMLSNSEDFPERFPDRGLKQALFRYQP
jgi:23S rRNA (cytosine1962-C5)-methyltransferase